MRINHHIYFISVYRSKVRVHSSFGCKKRKEKKEKKKKKKKKKNYNVRLIDERKKKQQILYNDLSCSCGGSEKSRLDKRCKVAVSMRVLRGCGGRAECLSA